MKKNEKTPKKPNSQGKKRTKAVKKSAKRKKNIFPDALRAFLLVGILTIFSAAISLAIITIHSRIKNAPVETAESEADIAKENIDEKSGAQNDNEIKPLPAIETPKPVIQVSIPANNNRTQAQAQRETVSPQPTRASPSANVDQNTAVLVRAAPPAAPNPERVNPTASNTVPSAAAPSAVSTVPASSAQRPPQNTGTLVFVIDDAGNNLRELEPFLRIPGPLTIAVMPGLAYSAEAARRIRAAGKEVILHQPMEAIGAQNPGPGAIYSGMKEEEIISILTRNAAEIGPIVGINNHQGSKISMDGEIAEIILKFCIEQGIFFLDSRTTAETVFPSYARRLGIKIAERDVFLDNEQDKNSMLRYITSGLTRAQRNGSAIMIGHVWSPELAPLLAEQFPVLTIQGYAIRTVSDMMR